MRYLHALLLIFLFASVTSAQQSWHVTLLGNWNDSAHVRPSQGGQRYNDVWGFTVKGKEYGVIGSTEGAHIIDIDSCKEVAFYPGSAAGPGIVHRDYKTYKNYLYAVCDESVSSHLSTLQVFDMQYLPDSLHLVYQSSPQQLSLCHNIFIDTATAKLYVGIARAGTTTDDMRVYSLGNPILPQLITTFNMFDKVHDMYVRNDTAYCSASFYGYAVVDCHVPGTYTVLGVLPEYTGKGYNHSSWINEKNIGVMADETHGLPLKVIDTKEIDNINVRSTFMARPGDPTCIPHNPFLLGNYALISYYYDGLQVFNIANPDSPVRTGYYDTYPGPNQAGYAGAWGCYPFLPSGRILVSDMETGFYIFDADSALGRTKPTQPPVISFTHPGAFNIFPNPAVNRLSISLPYEESGTLQVSIYSAAGKTMLKTSIYFDNKTNQPIELTLPGNCVKGIYTIRVVTQHNTYSSKFTKS